MGNFFEHVHFVLALSVAPFLNLFNFYLGDWGRPWSRAEIWGHPPGGRAW